MESGQVLSGELDGIVAGLRMGKESAAIVPVGGTGRRESVSHAVTAFILAKTAEGAAFNPTHLYARHLTEMTRWIHALGVEAMDDVTPDILRTYLAWLRESGRVNPGGLHQRFRVIRSLFRWRWREYDLTTPNPITKLKPPLPEKLLTPVPLADVERMLGANEDTPNPAARARNKAVLMALLDTGCRCGELLAWHLTDLDEAQGTLAIRRSKTRRVRTAYLGRKAGRAVRAWLPHRPERATALFCTLPDGDHLTYSGLRGLIRRLASRAKVPTPSLHSFRRAMATQFLHDGGSIYDLQKLLDHSGLGLIQKYAARSTGDLRAAHNARSPADRA